MQNGDGKIMKQNELSRIIGGYIDEADDEEEVEEEHPVKDKKQIKGNDK
jgi:hypothetical protein